MTQLLSQLITPCILPLSWLYLNNLSGQKSGHIMSAFWIIAPVFLFSSAITLHLLIGGDNVNLYLEKYDNSKSYPAGFDDNIYYLYHFFKSSVFRAVLLFEVVVMIFFLARGAKKSKFSFKNVRNFFFNDRSISPFHLQLFNFSLLIFIIVAKILLKRGFLIEHQWVAVLMSIIVCGLILYTGFVCMFGNWTEISRADMTFNQPRSYLDEAKEILEAKKDIQKTEQSVSETAETVEGADSMGEEIESPETIEIKEETPEIRAVNTALLSKFEDLIINRQLFLTPGLTINDIAEKLGTNRTYISQLVNDEYKMPFPDFLNSLRIDYAEQYILHNRDAKQNEVALACGFPSASSFNVTFKKITGVTPRIWLATYTDNKS
ncbi:MAG: helix-turn-helix domain-containing protein [Bacteroidales bacterium]|nr:helix-turn-helix domain-containing protein [Bacteroidales bacterium]